MISYTAAQTLLFDQDIASWTVSDGDWHQHASGAWMQFEITHSSSLLSNCKISDDSGAIVALLEMPAECIPAVGCLDDVLRRLSQVFSSEHRRRFALFSDQMACLLLDHGCTGEHRLYYRGVQSLRVIETTNTPVPIVIPNHLRAASEEMLWTPARLWMNSNILFSSSVGGKYIPLPTSAHDGMLLRARVQAAQKTGLA